MRIRAAIAASALATTIVMGGASAALAHGKDRHHHNHHGHYASCWLSAAVLHHVGPVFSEGCEKGGWGGGYQR
ncbi:hypothetical protein SAMN05428945_5617 [Streptomyces sp. 2224.1]|uniref:hypothetical protein n=1 Tax=unclassified Streptomyces TaxID=2593676 RepID=UPI00088C05E7|nr:MULTISPECIES: hypothetical protein [unclassified Streptomyces]PBC86808.1 hypothetical protein BX261_6917 [Streptomyces sp. 2321.6]SDQ71765.1 hypothetical protein SAMN05216511_0336 [Streptomyces sp. KS_16]SED43439.1 hypothetical protein SAMN05428954_0297 [Streptomyces sp. 2112.3]SED81211.1 hypothetical protein SAMN05428945_5617 [Streptomyces sp. 2224.1]SEE10079.1 hypothetical protein SAMN05428940_6942 [Streptomyces sp. 2133.1]